MNAVSKFAVIACVALGAITLSQAARGQDFSGAIFASSYGGGGDGGNAIAPVFGTGLTVNAGNMGASVSLTPIILDSGAILNMGVTGWTINPALSSTTYTFLSSGPSVTIFTDATGVAPTSVTLSQSPGVLGVLTPSTGLLTSGGSLTLTPVNTYAGGATIMSGTFATVTSGNLNLSPAGTVSGALTTASSGATNGSYTLNGVSGSFAVVNNNTDFALISGSSTTTSGGASMTVNSYASGTSSATVTTLSSTSTIMVGSTNLSPGQYTVISSTSSPSQNTSYAVVVTGGTLSATAEAVTTESGQSWIVDNSTLSSGSLTPGSSLLIGNSTSAPSSLGNGITFFTTIPEPGTWAMLSGGFGLLLALRGVRRR